MRLGQILSIVVVKAVFACGGSVWGQEGSGAAGVMAPQAGREPEHAAGQPLGHGYTRRGDHISFKGQRIDRAGRSTLKNFAKTMQRSLKLAEDVDAASFAALSEEYAKDKRKVYYKWTSQDQFWVIEIPGADPATFEVMESDLAKDAKRVWRTDLPIEGADAATARVVKPGFVWKDRHGVYYQFTRLDGADPASFRHLEQAFYRDADHVFWSTTPLKGADAATFRTFGDDVPYAADRRHVWAGETRLEAVDAGSFRLLHNHVFADKRGVYVSPRAFAVPGADAATFVKVADLATGGCVLFRDTGRMYLFDPYYIEVFTLTPDADAVVVSKPVWFGEAAGPVRHAATVAASWKDGALSEPEVRMQPAFEGKAKPVYEVEKLRRMTDAIREAMTLDSGKPGARTGQDGKPPVHGGGK